jgi:hypothetical protein
MRTWENALAVRASRLIFRAISAFTFLWVPGLAASAQSATPSPAPAATAAPAWHNPPNTNYSIFDPCGGPKELLNKFGPTPCVYIAGEAMVSAGYSNISAHASITVSRGALAAGLPLSGNANKAPRIGLGDRRYLAPGCGAAGVSWKDLARIF